VHCNGLNSIRARFVVDLLQTLSQTSQHVEKLEMVCVHHFCDLCRRLSPKVRDFMICHHLCLQLSWFQSTAFPALKFRWKSA